MDLSIPGLDPFRHGEQRHEFPLQVESSNRGMYHTLEYNGRHHHHKGQKSVSTGGSGAGNVSSQAGCTALPQAAIMS